MGQSGSHRARHQAAVLGAQAQAFEAALVQAQAAEQAQAWVQEAAQQQLPVP